MSRVVSIKYWVAETATHSATVTGAWLAKPYDGHVSADFSWTGTIAGTIKMQHRTAGGTAYDTPNASSQFTTQPAGSASNVQCNWANVPGTEYRFVYTSASGTGTITCNIAQGDMPE